MSAACKHDWCVVVPDPDAVYCRIHQKFPKLRLMTGTLASEGVNPDCSDCAGDGVCSECDGDGDHTCDCGDEHDCHHCDGSGQCPSCEDTKPERDGWSESYLRFAFDAGWQPFDAHAEWLK